MGTRSLGDQPWLVVDDERDDDLAVKQRLLSDRRPEVLHLTEWSESAAARLAELVGASDPTLEAAALAVQEDLCLLRRVDSGWHLDASCVCFPTRWRLQEKVGHHIAAVHAPVEGYTRIVDKVDRLFDRVTDRAVWRRNWFLMTDRTLFQPERPPHETIIDRDRVATDIYLRSERQTLRQVLPGWVVFTIRIQHRTLGEALNSVDRVDRFERWVRHVSDDFGQRRHLTEPQRVELLAALSDWPIPPAK